MKIFYNKKNGMGEKLNIVDKNNVFVGYNYSPSCCEDFGYFFSKTIPKEIPPKNGTIQFDPEEYIFDTSFFHQESFGKNYEGGGFIVFRLINGIEPIYLCLYNCHNGYYSHGFEMKEGNAIIHSGDI